MEKCSGNVIVDDAQALTMVKVHLRVSKCHLFGKGVDVYVCRIGTSCCPVVAMVTYSTAQTQVNYSLIRRVKRC